MDTAAIDAEKRALEQLAAAAKLAQVWTAWGGRSSPEQHISDLQRQLELQTLINRQEWLGFTSPQQAYSWRQNELNQRKLMNYAEFAGYQTADQYLSYLQKQRSGLAALNDTLLRRVDVYKENTDAALAYANALRGTHASVGQLGEGLDLSGISQFQSALVGLPDVVTTQLAIDDSDALAELSRYEALLQAVPRAETTVLTASQLRGAVPVGRPGATVIPVSYGHPGPVPEGQAAPEVIPVSYGGPYQEEFGKILAEVARLNELRAVIPVHFDLPSAAEVSRFVSHIPVAGVNEPVHLVSQGGGAGGGGGPPPVAPAPGADEPPDDAAAKWAVLAAAEKAAGDAAEAVAIKQKAAADNARGTAGALGQLASGFIGAAQGWAALGTRIALFGGFFSVALWHIIADAILEFIIALGGAIIGVAAMAAAVGIFIGVANLAQDTLGRISDRLKAVYTASTATGQAIYPLTNSFDKLAGVIRPEVWQLYGDALGAVGGRMGLLGQIAEKTGAELDTIAAKFVVWMNQPSVQHGFADLLRAGLGFARQFGQIFQNLGTAILGFLKAAELTHIAEDIGVVLIALTKLLDVVSHLPTPLLAAAFGLHAIFLWGGLAATALLSLLDPLRAVAIAAGGLDVAESALARLPQDASALDKLKATLSDIGAGFGALPGRITGTKTAIQEVSAATGQSVPALIQLQAEAEKSGTSIEDLARSTSNGAAMVEKWGANLSGASADAMNLAIAAGATEAQLAKISADAAEAGTSGGFLSRVFTALGGASGLATLGVGALAAAAGVFAYKALTAKDNTQQWIDSMNKGLGQQSLFTVIGKTTSDLAAVTGQLTSSQQLNAQATHELTGAQSQLSGQLQNELVHTADISRAYGVSMPQALGLLNTAGVKTSALFTDQAKVWAVAEQQVKGLVAGYAAMGQGLTQLQGDVSVQLVVNADQLKQMAQLNTAWDSFLTLVAGGETTFTKVQQDLSTTSTAAQQAGASMTGLNKNSISLRSAFIAMIPDAGKVLDAIRSQTAVLQDGAQGSALLTRATKDLAAEMIPLAGNNAAARASIVALVEEADPSVNTWQKLTRWVGREGAAGAASDLQAVLFKLATPVSDLAADAAKLTTTLQSDLNPAMAQAEFNALGGQKAFSTFAADLARFGPGSQVTVTAGQQVAAMLLSIDKNSTTARNQFVAWAESMGLSQAAAGKLWSQVSAGITPLSAMRQGLATSATASDNLAKSGFFAQAGDRFRTNMQQMATWFTKTLPDAFVTAGHGVETAWDATFRNLVKPADAFFTQTIPHAASAVGAFFAGPFRTTVEGAWAHVWSGLVSPVVTGFDDVKRAITGGFDGWWKSHGAEVVQVWQSATGDISREWDSLVGGLERAWTAFTSWFHGSGDVTKFLAGSWDKLVTDLQPVLARIEAGFKVTFGAVEAIAKIAWDAVAAAGKTAWDALMALFKVAWDGLVAAVKVAWDLGVGALKAVWDLFVGAINVALDLITGHWSKAWHDMQQAFDQVNNAINAAFRQTWNAIFDFLKQSWNAFDNFFHQLWNNSISFLRQLWNAWWSWFDRTIIQSGFGSFFTRTIPNWFTGFVNGAKTAWGDTWSWFNRVIIGNLRDFFTVTIPSWWNRFVQGGQNAMSGVASSIKTSFKDAINWVIDHVINAVINFIDNDILKHLPGGLHINTVGHVASGGDVSAAASGGAFTRMAAGSVPGTGDEDGTRIIAMGGEYMLRKPARMALEAAYGRGFMNYLNQADTWLSAGSRGSMASQQRRPGVNYAGGGDVITLATPLMATGGFVNPVGRGLRPERVDMGVDYGGAGPLYAIGPGTITNLYNRGWPGGTFIGLHLSQTPPAGDPWWYYAEDINPVGIGVGSQVRAGQHIANATGGGSGIEIGFAAPPGTGETMAAVTGESKAGQAHGDPGLYPTGWGEAASNFIASLGGPRGITSGPVQGGTPGIPGGFGFITQIWQSVEGLLDSAGNAVGSLVKPLAQWVSGGAGELLKLARQGAASIFGAVWDHSVKPLADLIPGDTIPGALAQGSAAEIRQGIVNFLKGQDQSAQSSAAAANAGGGGGGSIGPVSGPADAGPGQAENYARGRLGSFGWGPGQFPPLQSLWSRESGWNRFARNPSSGAYGIPQALPASKLPAAGQAGGGSHASPQIDWGLGYIKGRYSTPSGAWSHELSAGWYPQGGVVGGDGADVLGMLAAGGALPAWSGPLTTAVRTEMADFWDLLGSYPHTATPAQKVTYNAWSRALQAQQLKAIGLGHVPPGAFGAISNEFAKPTSITPAQWSAFRSGVSYLAKEEEGPGAGGINPPGTPANSGYVAWHYLHPQWQNLLASLQRLQSRAATAQAAWGTGSVTSGGPTGTTGSMPVGLAPEWTDAVGDVTGAVGSLNTAVVSVESPAFWTLMKENLSAIKGVTPAQAGAWHAWRTALTGQQYKTFGVGHSPPGAYAQLASRFGSPASITAGEWTALVGDVNYMVKEQAGTGIAGGINPPGTPANSGYVPWHYFNPQWKALRAGLLKVQQRIPAAQQVWQNIYGPAHLPYTPGPHGQPPSSGGAGTGINLEPIATMGGPSSPVLPGSGTPDMGFSIGTAAGGGLGDVAGMFAFGGAVPSMAEGGAVLPAEVITRLQRGRAAAEYPRSLGDAAAIVRGDRVGLKVESLTVNNPKPEPVGMSLAHATNRLSFLAGRDVA